jgi:site-specific recombinase XerD
VLLLGTKERPDMGLKKSQHNAADDTGAVVSGSLSWLVGVQPQAERGPGTSADSATVALPSGLAEGEPVLDGNNAPRAKKPPKPHRKAPTFAPTLVLPGGSRDGGIKFAPAGNRGAFVASPLAPDLATWPLHDAVDTVVKRWRAQALAGIGSVGTVNKYVAVLARFVAFAEALGVRSVADVTEDIVAAFVYAPLPSGRGRSPVLKGAAPAAGTAAVRKSAIGTLFRCLREDGLADMAPARGVKGGAQRRSRLRPATPTQVGQICDHAEAMNGASIPAGLVALMLSGASVAEAAWVTTSDLDVEHGTVRLPGQRGRYRSRVVVLGEWEKAVLTRRLASLRTEFAAAKNQGALADWPLAFPRPAGTYPYNHVSQTAGELVRDLITRSGLNVQKTGLTPMSLTQYAVNRLYARTGSVEQVAAMYGIKDLNAARGLISDEWQDEWALAEQVLQAAGGLEPRPRAVAEAHA